MRQYIVACQAHPTLVKLGLILARLFHFNRLGSLDHVSSLPGALAVLWRPRPTDTVMDIKDRRLHIRPKGSLVSVSSRPGARAVLWRPRPDGTRQSYYNLDLSFCLSVYQLLRQFWTDSDETWQEGRGRFVLYLL